MTNENIATGIIDGNLTDITWNGRGSHYYSNGKRISKSKAMEAISAFKNRSNKKIHTASTKSNDSDSNASEFFINYYADVKNITSVNAKIEKLTSMVGSYSFKMFQKWSSNKTSIGFTGKRLVQWVENATNRPEGDSINLLHFDLILDNFIKNGKRFQLKKEEINIITSNIPKGISIDAVKLFGDIISGHHKLGIPSSKIDSIKQSDV